MPNSSSKRPQQYLSQRSGIPAAIEGAISNQQPTTGQDHEKRDLAAQEASAAFAWWMVVVSAMGFIVTTIGTILLRQQIRLTREAVKDTGKATDAMMESNTIAERARREAANHAREAMRNAKFDAMRNQANAERQMRAYLDFNGVKFIRDEQRDTPESFRIGVSITVQNYGQTPAKEVTLAKVYSLKVKGGAWKALEIDNPTEPDNVGRIAAADHAGFELYFDIPRSLWGLLNEGKTVLRVDADVAYLDVFDKPQSVSGSYINKFTIMDNFGLITGTRKHT